MDSIATSNDPLAEDLLFGANAIADFLGINSKTASNKLTARLIPAGKEGGLWVASKATLRAYYARLSSGSDRKEPANGGRL